MVTHTGSTRLFWASTWHVSVCICVCDSPTFLLCHSVPYPGPLASPLSRSDSYSASQLLDSCVLCRCLCSDSPQPIFLPRFVPVIPKKDCLTRGHEEFLLLSLLKVLTVKSGMLMFPSRCDVRQRLCPFQLGVLCRGPLLHHPELASVLKCSRCMCVYGGSVRHRSSPSGDCQDLTG